MSVDPIALAKALINCPSVTPARGEVFDILEAAITPLGFTAHRWVMGEAPDMIRKVRRWYGRRVAR